MTCSVSISLVKKIYRHKGQAVKLYYVFEHTFNIFQTFEKKSSKFLRFANFDRSKNKKAETEF